MKRLIVIVVVCLMLISGASYATPIGTLVDNNTDTDGFPNTITPDVFNAYISDPGKVIQNQGIAKLDLSLLGGITIDTAQLDLNSSGSGGSTVLRGYADITSDVGFGDWNRGDTLLANIPGFGFPNSNFTFDITNFIKDIFTGPQHIAALNLRQEVISNGAIFQEISLRVADVQGNIFLLNPNSETVEQIAAVPEPTTVALLGIGLVSLAGGAIRRKLRRKSKS